MLSNIDVSQNRSWTYKQSTYGSGHMFASTIRPKKGCLFAPFRPTQNFGKLGLLVFVCFFFSIFNFASLNKILKRKFSKCIVTVPKVYCVGKEGKCVYPIYVSTRLFNVTYLNTENYIICIAFLQHPHWKKKKKKIDLATLAIFMPKGQTNLYFFRPNMYNVSQKELTPTFRGS